jgi:hypothetical protein
MRNTALLLNSDENVEMFYLILFLNVKPDILMY